MPCPSTRLRPAKSPVCTKLFQVTGINKRMKYCRCCDTFLHDGFTRIFLLDNNCRAIVGDVAKGTPNTVERLLELLQCIFGGTNHLDLGSKPPEVRK